jgi:hypothetical protein
MLGDAGANALGAMLGAAAARSLPRRARIWLLGGIAVLTVTSEKVSFTKVIEATPPLRWLDMLGRRPAPLASAGRTAGAGTADAGTAGASTAPAGTVPAITAPGGQAPAGESGSARPDGAQDRRRQPGRHRRAAATVSRTRSGAWISGLLKTRQRQEP